MTKQFYTIVTVGNIEITTVLGTDEFEQCVKNNVLNPTLLSASELELFIGTLAVHGLLEYYVSSSEYNFVYIRYGNVGG